MLFKKQKQTFKIMNYRPICISCRTLKKFQSIFFFIIPNAPNIRQELPRLGLYGTLEAFLKCRFRNLRDNSTLIPDIKTLYRLLIKSMNQGLKSYVTLYVLNCNHLWVELEITKTLWVSNIQRSVFFSSREKNEPRVILNKIKSIFEW